jgi:uncharacterized protein (DUF302 family)
MVSRVSGDARTLALDYLNTSRKEPRMKPFLVAMFGVFLMASSASAADTGLVTKASKYSVAYTVTRLEAVLKSSGMTVFARINHRAEAEKAGLTMRPAQLLVFGNPKGGTPLMTASPTVAIDLPLKALVWEDANGHVWLSHNSLAYLKSRHAITGQDELIGRLENALETVSATTLE